MKHKKVVRLSGYVLQMQTLSKPSKATNTYIQELISMMTALTLMRTQREKGRVTMTSSQEITKSSQPHAPIPESPPVWLSSVSGSETSTFFSALQETRQKLQCVQ